MTLNPERRRHRLMTTLKVTFHHLPTTPSSSWLSFSMSKLGCLREKSTSFSPYWRRYMMDNLHSCPIESSTRRLMQSSKAKYRGTASLSPTMVCALNGTLQHGWMQAMKSGLEACFKSSVKKQPSQDVLHGDEAEEELGLARLVSSYTLPHQNSQPGRRGRQTARSKVLSRRARDT